MQDNYNNPTGYFKIELLNEQNHVIDVYEDKNLIMDEARNTMAGIIAGGSAFNPINKIVLGTSGHNVDIQIPKTAAEGFTPDRTNLFTPTYAIEFAPNPTLNGACTVTDEPDNGTTVTLNKSGTEITYVIDIPGNAANDTGTVSYTEAAFFCDNDIFNMKTFIGKIKDASSILRITWKITF